MKAAVKRQEFHRGVSKTKATPSAPRPLDRLSARAIRPEHAFLLVGLIFGLGMLVLTPPFQVPDEPQHFFRAFQFSELRFRDLVQLEPNPNEGINSIRSGTMLPKSLAALVESSSVATIRFRPDNKVNISRIRANLATALNAADRQYLPVPAYPPAAYMPQVVGIWISRMLGLSPLMLFYVARLSALFVWLALTFIAIRTTPILKWAFFLLALMPMTLFLAGSNSSDSVLLGVSFLLSATVFRWAYDPQKERIAASDYAALLALALLITLSKAVYLGLLFLYFLVPQRKFKSRQWYWVGLAVILAVSAGTYWGWNRLSTSSISQATTAQAAAVQTSGAQAGPQKPTIQFSRYSVDDAPVPNVSPAKQKEFIRSNPVAFLGVLANTFSMSSLFYLNSFVGYLGWLDTPLPSWLVYTYALALIAACFLSSGGVNWKQRAVAGAVFVITTLMSLTYLYLGWSSVGMGWIEGMQGRYLIPAAPALLLVFSAKSRPVVRNMASIVLIALVVLANSVAGYSLIERFYLPRSAYHLDELFVAPNGVSLIVRGWAIDKANSKVAGEVTVAIDGHDYAAKYGQERPDAVDALGNDSFRFSGFEVTVPMDALKAGDHALALRILTHDRKLPVALGSLNFNVDKK